MSLAGLEQAPCETTLMGVVKGALDYHGIQTSAASAFGGSGHAFAINVHKQICPSSPYVWNLERVFALTSNLGLDIEPLGFFHGESSPSERASLEARVVEALDAGIPCSLCNMDNQLITGYDDLGFLTARPWPQNTDYPADRLTFGTWSEFGEECHVSFFVLRRGERVDDRRILRDALTFAMDAWRRPEAFTFEGYGFGPHAYTNWLAAVEAFGASHGQWWNATVWSECRRMGSEYLAASRSVAPELIDDLSALSDAYGTIAELLLAVSDRELAPGEKSHRIREAADREATAVDGVERLLESLGSHAP